VSRFPFVFALLVAPVLAPADARAQVSSTQREIADLLEAWDIEGAEAAVDAALAAAPDDPALVFAKGRVAFESGEYATAVDLFEKSLGERAKETHEWALAVGAMEEAKNTVVEESAHFTFRYRPGRDAALIPYAVEALEAAFAALTKDLDYVPPRKVRVEFLGSPQVLAKVSSLTVEAVKTTGTIALCKYNRLMVTSPRALVHGYDWQDTLTHEFVHFLVTRKSRNTVPIWLHEGMAKFLETRWRGPPGLALEPGAERLLTDAVKADKLITFARMHPSIALLPSQEDAALAFAEVFTAIEWVHARKGPAGLRTIIDALKGGATDHDAVSKAVGSSFEQFEALWKASLSKRPVPALRAGLRKLEFQDEKRRADAKEKKEGDRSYDRGELGSVPDVDARKAAHLGELLRSRKRPAAAAIEFEKAIAKVGPAHPVLARKYALVKLDLGRGADAEKVLRQSLDAFPDETTNHLVLGKVLLQAKREAEAGPHFQAALRRDPFDEEIHQGLVLVARATKDKSLEQRETKVLEILGGARNTWRAARPGDPGGLGYLRIESPAGASLWLDGVDTGLSVPVAELEVPAGTHVVKLVVEGAAPQEAEVVVPADTLVPFPPQS